MSTIPPLSVGIVDRNDSQIQSVKFLNLMRVTVAVLAALYPLGLFFSKNIRAFSRVAVWLSCGWTTTMAYAFRNLWNYEIFKMDGNDRDKLKFSHLYSATQESMNFKDVTTSFIVHTNIKGVVDEGGNRYYWLLLPLPHKPNTYIYNSKTMELKRFSVLNPAEKLVDEFIIPPPPPTRPLLKNRSISGEDFKTLYQSVNDIYDPSSSLEMQVRAKKGKLKGERKLEDEVHYFVFEVGKLGSPILEKPCTVSLQKKGSEKYTKVEFSATFAQFKKRFDMAFHSTIVSPSRRK